MASENPNEAGSAQSVITLEEYDFSAVPQKELLACLIYEYARESRAVRREVTADRKKATKSKGKSRIVKFGPRVRNPIQGSLLLQLSCCPGFPELPWQRLSAEYRERLMKHLAAFPLLLRYFATSDKPALSFAPNVPRTMTLEQWKQQYRKRCRGVSDSDPIKFGFFAVNLKYGYAVLIDEFKGILRTLEGKPILEWPPPAAKQPGKTRQLGRRPSLHDPLRALGAMRLRYFCDTFTEAKKLMRRKSKGTSYSRRDNCTRACNRALEKFRELFGWLDSQKPIHFTEGWKGGTQK